MLSILEPLKGNVKVHGKGECPWWYDDADAQMLGRRAGSQIERDSTRCLTHCDRLSALSCGASWSDLHFMQHSSMTVRVCVEGIDCSLGVDGVCHEDKRGRCAEGRNGQVTVKSCRRDWIGSWLIDSSQDAILHSFLPDPCYTCSSW